MSKKVISASKAFIKIGEKVIEFPEGDFTFEIDEVGSRWSGSDLNLQNLPKPPIAVDYGEMETRIVSMAFPGEDGIGPDFYDLTDVLKNISDKIEERKPGMPPWLGAPYAADILKTEDVVYGSHRAKVKQFNSDKNSVEIEFNDKALIPPTMWVPLYAVKYAYGGSVINPHTHCPNCNVQWKETMLARFSVYDCPSCGAKKEDHAR